MDYIDPLSQWSGAPQAQGNFQAPMTQPQQQHFLTPEDIAAQIIGQDVGMQEKEIAHQRALAQALRQPGQQHTTGLGAVLGGVGDIFNKIHAREKEDAATSSAQALSAQDLKQRRADAAYRSARDAKEDQRQDALLRIMGAKYGVEPDGTQGY